MVNDQLQPLIRIGDRVAPALRLLVCEPLGAIVTAHNGGWHSCPCPCAPVAHQSCLHLVSGLPACCHACVRAGVWGSRLVCS